MHQSSCSCLTNLHLLVSQQLQEANARLEAELAEMELAPVQRKIEARSSDDSFTGLVRTLYFADTFLSDSKSQRPASVCMSWLIKEEAPMLTQSNSARC